MHSLKHTELTTLEKDLDANYRDPWFSLAFLSTTYEGFGLGFSNIAAAAAWGLRIPLAPVYGIGLFTGVCYFLLKIRSTRNDRRLQQEKVLSIERSIINDEHYHYWSSKLPKFTKADQEIDLISIVNTHTTAEIADCLGHYYRTVPQGSAQGKLLRSHFAAEASQFNDPLLVQRLNDACGEILAQSSPPPEISWIKKSWHHVRKYYKSSLTGAATAGGLTIFIISTALSTATTTALFPWSLVGILVITITGGVLGYKIDKYFDRKHKINLQKIADSQLTLRNKKRLMDLFVRTQSALLASPELEQSSEAVASPTTESSPSPVLLAPPPTLSEQNYLEVTELQQQSQLPRRAADFILPTLLVARGGFAAISNLFAGIGFAGLLLPLTPVFIGGGLLLGLHIIFKIINNVLKHSDEAQRIINLNAQISPAKVAFWQAALPTIGNVEQLIKNKTTAELLTVLEEHYTAFCQQLRGFESNQISATNEELQTLHQALLSLFRAQVASLSRQDDVTKLRAVAKYPITTKAPEDPINSAWNSSATFFSPIATVVMNNFKDIAQGAAFGFGVSLTAFVIVGITTLVTSTALLIACGAALGGIAIKLAIRYGIKAARYKHLATIDKAAKSISDKECLMDCLVATQAASEEAKRLIDQRQQALAAPLGLAPASPKTQSTQIESAYAKAKTRPLLWIETGRLTSATITTQATRECKMSQ